MKRTCSAIACTRQINLGATFCDHHWHILPSAMQMTIAGLNKRARSEGADTVQHRWMYSMLQARQAVAKLERRGFPAIPPGYKARADEEQSMERMAA